MAKRVQKSLFVLVEIVLEGVIPVNTSSTFSASCSLRPPSPTPMFTVTLVMAGESIGLETSVMTLPPVGCQFPY